MKKQKYSGLDFVIDRLTNSIQNAHTSEVFDTEIIRLSEKDSKQIKKVDWQFNWSKELKTKGRKFTN